MLGVVKNINENKGYGFIRRHDGEDVFFHVRSLEDLEWDETLVEREVEFETGIDQNSGRERATVVRARR